MDDKSENAGGKGKGKGKDKKKGGGEGEGEGEEEDGGDDDEADGEDQDGKQQEEETMFELLYRPISLKSAVQKRRQIFLLQHLIRETMLAFNVRFGDMFALKEEEMERIKGKNARIAEILEELSTSEDFFQPDWRDSELPERVITVRDEEMPIERYVSEAEKERLAREEEERLAREAANQGDNLGERALNDMMNGTLEVQAETGLQAADLVREDWMDEVAFEDMSEEQRKELEAFESKQKEYLAEREKYRKGLELELKKLKTDVQDICRVFDDKLEGMWCLSFSFHYHSFSFSF